MRLRKLTESCIISLNHWKQIRSFTWYKTYVRPVLEYGTTVFSPKCKREISRLESVQNSFTRKLWIRVHGCNYANIPSALVRNKLLNLRTLAFRRKRYDLITIYKLINGMLDLPLQEFYSLSCSNTRGGQMKIQIPKARSNIRSTFFTDRAGTEFQKFSKKNILPKSLRQYKRLIDRYLQDVP